MMEVTEMDRSCRCRSGTVVRYQPPGSSAAGHSRRRGGPGERLRSTFDMDTSVHLFKRLGKSRSTLALEEDLRTHEREVRDGTLNYACTAGHGGTHVIANGKGADGKARSGKVEVSSSSYVAGLRMAELVGN